MKLRSHWENLEYSSQCFTLLVSLHFALCYLDNQLLLPLVETNENVKNYKRSAVSYAWTKNIDERAISVLSTGMFWGSISSKCQCKMLHHHLPYKCNPNSSCWCYLFFMLHFAYIYPSFTLVFCQQTYNVEWPSFIRQDIYYTGGVYMISIMF